MLSLPLWPACVLFLKTINCGAPRFIDGLYNFDSLFSPSQRTMDKSWIDDDAR